MHHCRSVHCTESQGSYQGKDCGFCRYWSLDTFQVGVGRLFVQVTYSQQVLLLVGGKPFSQATHSPAAGINEASA